MSDKPQTFYPNQPSLANAITKYFRIPCVRQTIQTWQKLKDPPFPMAREDGRYNTKECFKWVQKYIIESKDKDATLDREERKANRERIAEEKETFEFDRTLGKYVLVQTAKIQFAGAIKIYHGIVRAQLERITTIERKKKLEELGVSPEIIAAFYDYDVKLAVDMVTAIEDATEKAGKSAECEPTLT